MELFSPTVLFLSFFSYIKKSGGGRENGVTDRKRAKERKNGKEKEKKGG